MRDCVTVCRFICTANSQLIGDGDDLTVINWPEQTFYLDLDALAQDTNAVGRIAFIVHSSAEFPNGTYSQVIEELGFAPTDIERETFRLSELVEKGARDDWFDAYEDGHALMPGVFVLFPDTATTREDFRVWSREFLTI